MKKTLLTLAALAVAAPVTTVPAVAADFGQHIQTGSKVSLEQTSEYRRRDRDGYRGRVWRDNRGRYRCKRDNGTTGLLIGAGVGGLAGHEIAGRGDKTLGTVIGAAGGALLGREIDRSGTRCR